jgi:hypothetical protein
MPGTPTSCANRPMERSGSTAEVADAMDRSRLAVGWCEHRVALFEVDRPLVVVDEAVVVRTQHHAVFQAGFAAVCPVSDVVTVAPAWWA